MSSVHQGGYRAHLEARNVRGEKNRHPRFLLPPRGVSPLRLPIQSIRASGRKH